MSIHTCTYCGEPIYHEEELVWVEEDGEEQPWHKDCAVEVGVDYYSPFGEDDEYDYDEDYGEDYYDEEEENEY